MDERSRRSARCPAARAWPPGIGAQPARRGLHPRPIGAFENRRGATRSTTPRAAVSCVGGNRCPRRPCGRPGGCRRGDGDLSVPCTLHAERRARLRRHHPVAELLPCSPAGPQLGARDMAEPDASGAGASCSRSAGRVCGRQCVHRVHSGGDFVFHLRLAERLRPGPAVVPRLRWRDGVPWRRFAIFRPDPVRLLHDSAPLTRPCGRSQRALFGWCLVRGYRSRRPLGPVVLAVGAVAQPLQKHFRI